MWIQLLSVLVVWWFLLYLRVVPRRVMQWWFVTVCFILIFPMCGLTVLVTPLRSLGVSRYWAERICIVPLCAVFRLVRWLNPQIRMACRFERNVQGKPSCWADLPMTQCAIVSNHLSFWDTFMFIVAYPFFSLTNVRTLLKASLLDIPLFGPSMRRVGHFPVYFKSDEHGNFQVDKERQAKVQVGVDRHIKEGGSIAMFPEGAMNRNPKQLQPFRFGTFQTIIDHRLTTYYALIVGNEQTWPRGSMLGGLPADIIGRVGAFPIDFDSQSAKDVSASIQAHMQGVLDTVFADQRDMMAGKKVEGYQAF